MTVYADNAATTRMSRTALDAMLPAMEENYGNPSGLHSVGQRAAELLRDLLSRILIDDVIHALGQGVDGTDHVFQRDALFAQRLCALGFIPYVRLFQLGVDLF